MPPDVTFNEGVNSLLKRIQGHCPSIKLPLLAARVGMKACLSAAQTADRGRGGWRSSERKGNT
eukprot:4498072-Alexandrium_andersonii.AAC.1